MSDRIKEIRKLQMEMAACRNEKGREMLCLLIEDFAHMTDAEFEIEFPELNKERPE